MSELSRIGVAIDSDLLDKFDALIARRGYTNRSEAFRDLIRDDLDNRTSAVFGSRNWAVNSRPADSQTGSAKKTP